MVSNEVDILMYFCTRRIYPKLICRFDFHAATTFTVLWENVSLQDQPSGGNFTFEATLKSNGDIIFVYQNIPNITAELSDHFHPVKIGLSDAYIMDKSIFCELNEPK